MAIRAITDTVRHVENFLAWMELRGARSCTVSGYARDLAEYLEHLAAVAGQGLITLELLEKAGGIYLDTLRARGNSPRSIARRAGSLRSFGKFLARRGVVPQSPFACLASPKIPKRQPATASAEEVRATLGLVQNPTHRLIIALLTFAGLRASEIRGIRVEHIARGPRQLTLGERQITMSPELLTMVEDQMVTLPRLRGPLFPGRRRGSLISLSAIRQIVYRYTTLAGRRLPPRALRHAFSNTQRETEEPPWPHN